MSRRPVVKTYKLYVGGAFVRSESGRSDQARDHAGDLLANVPRASRKDVRDAIRTARGAFPKWSGRTAYNRGQILYRFAEALESRADELAGRSAAVRGIPPERARRELEAAVDLAVHHAGWTDKLHALLGAVHPVAMPYFGFSLPEPTGVVVVLAPDEPDVLGLVGEILPPLAAGNVVVALVSERYPLAPLDVGEVLGVSDVPAGVVNLLAGRRAELVPHLAGHRDVNAILDATGDDRFATQLGELAAETVKRLRRVRRAADDLEAWRGLENVEPFVELKTAWHPVGV